LPDATLLQAVTLGGVEGVTEFLPVSSTGHLILVGHLIGFEGNAAKIFEVVIQLGAILAVFVLYFGRLARAVIDLPRSREARNFALSIIIAFIPSAILGLIFHDAIRPTCSRPGSWSRQCSWVASPS
jgi:undecaprenyl-diphosphatase